MLGTSAKENERRLPLHPDHFPRLDKEMRERITLETGYADIRAHRRGKSARVAGFASREEIIDELRRAAATQAADGDVAAMARPGAVGVAALRAGHRMTQPAIDRRLTLIAFEAMNHWTRRGVRPARVPQEQRACRLLLRTARIEPDRLDR